MKPIPDEELRAIEANWRNAEGPEAEVIKKLRYEVMRLRKALNDTIAIADKYLQSMGSRDGMRVAFLIKNDLKTLRDENLPTDTN